MAKKENTQSCFQRGLISLLILALLDQEDMYGYQIVQEITERSGGAIVYYHLEEPGRRRLQELSREYRAITQGVFQIIQGGAKK